MEICWNFQADAIPSADNEGRLQAFMRTLVGGTYTGGIVPLQRDFDSYCREKISPQFYFNIQLEDINKEDLSLGDDN